MAYSIAFMAVDPDSSPLRIRTPMFHAPQRPGASSTGVSLAPCAASSGTSGAGGSSASSSAASAVKSAASASAKSAASPSYCHYGNYCFSLLFVCSSYFLIILLR